VQGAAVAPTAIARTPLFVSRGSTVALLPSRLRWNHGGLGDSAPQGGIAIVDVLHRCCRYCHDGDTVGLMTYLTGAADKNRALIVAVAKALWHYLPPNHEERRLLEDLFVRCQWRSSRGSRVIARFAGPHDFLSNFYPSAIQCEGETYPTVEHAFQAAKTADPEERAWVRSAPTPAAAKSRGRRVALRPDWGDVKVRVMEMLVRAKFSGPLLAERLLATGTNELVEGNSWGDRTWGAVWDGYRRDGRNELGRILMQIRAELRGAPTKPSRNSSALRLETPAVPTAASQRDDGSDTPGA